MNRQRSFAGRLMACTRFELAKLSRRPMGWLSCGIIILATLLVAWLKTSSDEQPESFILLTSILRDVLPLLAFILLMLGTLSINDEAASGALRSIVMRPIGRTEIILSKALVLAIFGLIATVVQCLVAYWWVQSHAPLTHVAIAIEGFEPDLKFTKTEMMVFTVKLLAMTLPAILMAPILGILLSLLVEAPGTSVAVSVFLFGGMGILGAALPSTRCLFFPATIDHLMALLAELSEGVETNVDVANELGIWSDIFWIPSAILATILSATVALFNLREIKC